MIGLRLRQRLVKGGGWWGFEMKAEGSFGVMERDS